jgi:hypothetical protein
MAKAWIAANPEKFKASRASQRIRFRERIIQAQRIVTLSDIQIACDQCNRTKGRRAMQEFVGYCRLVVQRYERRLLTVPAT